MKSAEYITYRNKLSSMFCFVFIEDETVVPKNLQTTIISVLHKGHPAINKMNLSARHSWWPKITEAIQKQCETSTPCKMSGRGEPNKPNTEKNIPPLNGSYKKIVSVPSEQSQKITTDFIDHCKLDGSVKDRGKFL